MRRNEGFEYSESLGPEADGRSLLDYLAQHYVHSSRERWEVHIEAGLVLVDSKPATAIQILRRGQTLIWHRPAWDEPAAPESFAILYKDDDLLAVAKPAGLPTLPGGGFLQSTLLYRVRDYDASAAPLHRLGRWTSGVVLCGRTREARAELTRVWNTSDVVKRYRALAVGDPERDQFEVAVPIGPVPYRPLGTVHAVTPEGKPATTRAAVLERREGRFLCDVYIDTGRPHQIRIHLAAAGHPLLGDPLYGPGGLPAPDCRALPGDPGYHLHAASLSFPHPRTGALICINCSPPPVLRAERGT
jgi:23S rRNA pseudouridine1911/1915/1917 synthase